MLTRGKSVRAKYRGEKTIENMVIWEGTTVLTRQDGKRKKKLKLQLTMGDVERHLAQFQAEGTPRCRCQTCLDVEAAYFANKARLAGASLEEAEKFITGEMGRPQ